MLLIPKQYAGARIGHGIKSLCKRRKAHDACAGKNLPFSGGRKTLLSIKRKTPASRKSG
jgi:hypothetical protein